MNKYFISSRLCCCDLKLFFEKKRWLVVGIALICGLVTALLLSARPVVFHVSALVAGEKVSSVHPDKDAAINAIKSKAHQFSVEKKELREKINALLQEQRQHIEDTGFFGAEELLAQKEVLEKSDVDTSHLESRLYALTKEVGERSRTISPYDVVNPAQKVGVVLARSHLDLTSARELYAEYIRKKNEIEDAHNIDGEQHSRIVRRIGQVSDIIVGLLTREIEVINAELAVKRALKKQKAKKIAEIDAAIQSIPERIEKEKQLAFEIEIAQEQLKRALLKSNGAIEVTTKRAPVWHISVLATLLGGLLAGMLSMRKGLPLSLAHIQEEGGHVSGALVRSKEESANIATLRNVSGFVGLRKKVALLLNKGPNYSHELAKLFAKQGKKTLLVQAHFSPLIQTSDVPGLSHYLSGEVIECPIRELDGYSYIPMGEKSVYGPEILRSNSFTQFLEEMSERFDQILLYSRGEAEGRALMEHVDVVAFTINGEKRLSFDRDVTFLTVRKN